MKKSDFKEEWHPRVIAIPDENGSENIVNEYFDPVTKKWYQVTYEIPGKYREARGLGPNGDEGPGKYGKWMPLEKEES